ncbi:Fic family protein [Photorhabdus temperata]|uniref:protein adenylyltransferase n=1 Tax=Photorhabdus temperata subsp. temperata Meg1 TaxID=1393735 RepID=A0A081RV97_PHOTE|nr:Fic family protein [Photorhabdus temperata]KER02600.1 protein involved in cell division [Photorhabdus temperata subsp. temperata Meg1]MCT8347994.1 Fic family protein [Photorhabdus temperata]
MSAKYPLTAEQREALEASHTFRRIVELRLDPVRGRFDAGHLKEINRRIFQDLPGLGFDDVTPGEYRPPVPAGNDWIKVRSLETVGAISSVAYSLMDEAAQKRLDEVLAKADPAKLGKLKTAEFTHELGQLYSQADYIHPFRDGNSRSLREFTRQLAEASGYTLNWERFGRSPHGRDVLYIARDQSVNELALPHLQHDSTKRAVNLTIYQFENNRDLPDLLRDAIRPIRAIAFEQSAEAEALRAHPELGEAFKTLRTAAQYFETKIPNEDGRNRALATARAHVQGKLDAGETRNFRDDPQARQKTLNATTKNRNI